MKNAAPLLLFAGQNRHYFNVFKNAIDAHSLPLYFLNLKAALEVGAFSTNIATKNLQIDAVQFDSIEAVTKQFPHGDRSRSPALHRRIADPDLKFCTPANRFNLFELAVADGPVVVRCRYREYFYIFSCTDVRKPPIVSRPADLMKWSAEHN